MKINGSALVGHAFKTVALAGGGALLGLPFGAQFLGACCGASAAVWDLFQREGNQVLVGRAATLEEAKDATHSPPFAEIPAALSNLNSALQAAVSIPVAGAVVAMAALL